MKARSPSKSKTAPKSSRAKGRSEFPVGSRWRTFDGEEITVTMYYEVMPGCPRLCYDTRGGGGHMGKNHIDRLTPINAHEWPGTRQLCIECGEATERCEEDAIHTEDGHGPLCVPCYHKTPEWVTANARAVAEGGAPDAADTTA